MFYENKKYHTKKYNDLFRAIVFSNMCDMDLYDAEGTLLDQSECEGVQEGILKQGLHTALVKHWDYLLQLYVQFFASDRSWETIVSMLNDAEFRQTEDTFMLYLAEGSRTINQQMQSDIDHLYILLQRVSFEKSVGLELGMALGYAGALLLAFAVGWKLFMRSLTSEFWVSKSLLALIPPEKLMNTPEIKDFILKNSGAAFFSRRAS